MSVGTASTGAHSPRAAPEAEMKFDLCGFSEPGTVEASLL